MRQFDASNWLKPDFEFMGALETPIEAIDGDGVVAKGKRIEAANVIWCAGVEASPVARLSRPCEFPNTFKVKTNISNFIRGKCHVSFNSSKEISYVTQRY